MISRPVSMILRTALLFCIHYHQFANGIEPPVVQPFIISKTLRLGNRLLLMCTISQGDDPVKFKWYHNGKELPSSNNDENGLMSSFRINKIKASDLGNYTCLASNAAGSDSYTAKLEVEAPPVWLSEPQDATAVLGSEVSLSCDAVGYPKPKISWMKEDDGTGNNFTPIIPDSRRSVLENGTLFISRAVIEDGGYYKCEAHNNIQPGLSKIVKLVISVPPRLVGSFKVENVRKGEAAVLKCQAIGDQPVSITWKKDGKTIIITEKERYEIISKETPTGSTSELIVRQTQREDGGVFSCVAKNSVGEQEGKVELVIAEPPSSPLSLTVTDVSSRSVHLSWRPAVSPSDEPLVGYVIRFWKTAGGSKQLREVQVVQKETTIFLKDLRPGTSYTAQVLAQNAVGFSEPSKPAGFRTHEEAPSSGPTNIRAIPTGQHEISVSWTAPPSEHWNGILKGYYVGHRPFGSSAQFSYKSITFAEYQSDEGFLVQGLEKGTKYSIIVKAYNSAGSGPPSHELLVQTLGGEPPAAPVVSIPEVTISALKVTWFPLKQNVQPIIQYLLQYRREGSEWFSLHIPSARDYLLLDHLEQGKRYDVKMAAYNKYGRGNFSRAIAVTTDSGFIVGEIGPVSEETPLFVQPHLVIPFAASFVVIVTAIVVAWVCYKKQQIKQEMAAANPIPPDQMYPYNRNSLAQSDGYCDISRIPLYLQPSGITRTASNLEMMPRRSANEEGTYDTPWDANQRERNIEANGNYTRLKSGRCHTPILARK